MMQSGGNQMLIAATVLTVLVTVAVVVIVTGIGFVFGANIPRYPSPSEGNRAIVAEQQAISRPLGKPTESSEPAPAAEPARLAPANEKPKPVPATEPALRVPATGAPHAAPIAGDPSAAPAAADVQISRPRVVDVPATQPLRPTVAKQGDLEVEITAITRSTDPAGVEITLVLRNRADERLEFSFAPAYDLRLMWDGRPQRVEWAAYRGQVGVEPGEQADLVRAFFAGKLTGPASLALLNVPGIGGTTWNLDLGDGSSPIALDRIRAEGLRPERAPDGARPIGTEEQLEDLRIQVQRADVNSELGGIVAKIAVQNRADHPSTLDFDPKTFVRAIDSRGRQLEVGWARFRTPVTIQPGDSESVEVFFRGAVRDNTVKHVKIMVQPSAAAGSATWFVPLYR